MGIGGDIKGFIVAHAGIGARRDIAHHIAACFAGGNINCGKPTHQIGRVVDVDKMQLKILPGSHMANGIGILFRQIGQGVHLFSAQSPKGNFNAHHTGRIPSGVRPFGEVAGGIIERLLSRAIVPQAVIVALTVDTAPQTRLGKDFFIDFILTPQLDLGVVNRNFFVQRSRDLPCQTVFPTGKLAHLYVP